MDDEFDFKEVIVSKKVDIDLKEIYNYSVETFGERKAKEYASYLYDTILSLDRNYLMYPQCQQLPTKRKIYRRIIAGSHIIIYRIAKQIEVLRILHSSSSNRKIRSARTVEIFRIN
jgi:plasmid stabilization system protein ParE